MIATCPFLDCTSVIVTRANSLFDVSVTPVTTLLDGNCQVGFVPDAVCVPPALTSPDENTITPQFAQPPMLRAIHTGMPGLPFTAAVLHVVESGSGRKPPHHGGSGFSLKAPYIHSRI